MHAHFTDEKAEAKETKVTTVTSELLYKQHNSFSLESHSLNLKSYVTGNRLTVIHKKCNGSSD